MHAKRLWTVICSSALRPLVMLSSPSWEKSSAETVTTSSRFACSSTSRAVMIFVVEAG